MAQLTYVIVQAADSASLSLAISASLNGGYTLYGNTFVSGAFLCQPMVLQSADYQNFLYNPERLSRNYRHTITGSALYNTASGYL